MRGPRSRRNILLIAAALLVVALALAWLGFAKREPVSPQKAAIAASKTPPSIAPQILKQISAQDARALNAKVPLVTKRPKPAAPFHYEGGESDKLKAVDCLAAAAWYEAGSNARWQKAVIQTVINRARHPAFPATICGVVFQGSERRTGCQFTFTCDSALARRPSDVTWENARALAQAALEGATDPEVGYATHYHADYVVPYWQDSLDKIAVVGPHIFYRWPGHWGKPGSFRRPVNGPEPTIVKLASLSLVHAQADMLAPPLAESVEGQALDQQGLASPAVPPVSSLSSLRGSEVRGVSHDGRLIAVKLDPVAFPGSYALTALSLCKGKRACLVLGWRTEAAMAGSLPLPEDSLRGLTFLFVRNVRLGPDKAFWNCLQIHNVDTSKCLPANPAETSGLLRLD